MISPVAGEMIASRSAFVILGGRKPALDDLNSKIDEGSGVIVVLLIPTPCPMVVFIDIKLMTIKIAPVKKKILFIE